MRLVHLRWPGWWPAALLLPFLPCARLAAQHEHHQRTGRSAPTAGAEESRPASDLVVETHRIRENGVALEMLVAARPDSGNPARVIEGEDVQLWLTLRGADSGEVLSERSLAVWVDRRTGSGPTAADACHDKVQSYVQGQVQYRPAVDLTSYFVLALNNGNTISVIDPFLGFGSSKLYTTVQLPSPGEDWVLEEESQQLFVTLPLTNSVAVVRTADFKVDTTLMVGLKPTRIVLAPDGRTVWVADGELGKSRGGVSVIDVAGRRVLARIETGAGAHEIAFSGDGRYAFVSNSASGTVSVIDARGLRSTGEVHTGDQPVALAWSSVAGAVFVAHRGDGGLVSIDLARMATGRSVPIPAGVAALGFDPSGRWGIAANAANDSVYVVDAGTGALAHVVGFGKAPDQVSFTRNFAYLRSSGSVDVGMIPLARLADPEPVPVQAFPAGELPPNQFGTAGSARAIAGAMSSDPHMADAVYVPNPADQSIYYYHYMEGMPTPSGRLNNYGFEPKATLVVGRDLRESTPGVYRATFKAPPAGPYDVVLLMDEPRVLSCVGIDVRPDEAKRAAEPPHLRIEPRWTPAEVVVGDSVSIRFGLADRESGEPQNGIQDLMALLSSPTGWNDRLAAPEVSAGVYEVRTRLPTSGVYYLFVASRALRLKLQDQPAATLIARHR